MWRIYFTAAIHYLSPDPFSYVVSTHFLHAQDEYHILFILVCSLPVRAGKIRFSGEQRAMILKASSGERCAPHKLVLLVTLQSKSGCLTV